MTCEDAKHQVMI